MNEWRPIPGWPGYEASDDGEVRSWLKVGFAPAPAAPRVLRTTVDQDGYRRMHLHRDGKRRSRKVASLVLETFVGPRPSRLDACHNDGVRSNDVLLNLRWDTRKSNLADREQHGTVNRGERNGHASLDEAVVRDIKRRLALREPQSSIAASVGCAQSTVSKINLGARWAHVQ